MYVCCLTKVLRGSERWFQLQRKVLRMSNFIPLILKVAPSTKLTFLNVAARFATQAQLQLTREGAGSSRLPAHSFPASGCLGGRTCPCSPARCQFIPNSDHLKGFFLPVNTWKCSSGHCQTNAGYLNTYSSVTSNFAGCKASPGATVVLR